LTTAPLEFPVEGLADGGLRLRLQADTDVPDIVEACRDPAVRRFTTVPEPYGPEDALDWERQANEGRAGGTALALIIADAETDRLLGSMSIRRHATDHGRWDLGYLVAPWARGRGVATRAVRLLSLYAQRELGAERIEICVEPENEASQRVAERAGFTREGVLRAYHPLKGRRRDMIMYSVLRGELR
jgi:RimJ/RimL family protein N-acetyltransferase